MAIIDWFSAHNETGQLYNDQGNLYLRHVEKFVFRRKKWEFFYFKQNYNRFCFVFWQGVIICSYHLTITFVNKSAVIAKIFHKKKWEGSLKVIRIRKGQSFYKITSAFRTKAFKISHFCKNRWQLFFQKLHLSFLTGFWTDLWNRFIELNYKWKFRQSKLETLV